jgi:anaerobic selenocysteine-containing dehydrogenase
VERITGVPVAAQREAVRMLGTQTTAMVLTARGPEQRSKEMTGRSQLIRYVYPLHWDAVSKQISQEPA